MLRLRALHTIRRAPVAAVGLLRRRKVAVRGRERIATLIWRIPWIVAII